MGLMLTLLSIRVLEGRDKSLLCQASGIPTPVITWSFSDRVLDSENGLLDLVDVGRNQEGRYVCLAKNRYGVTEREVQLQVIRGLRKENENLVPDIVKNIKDTISLPCDFKVDKRVENETKFIWLKNSEELTIDDSRYSLLPNKSLLLQNISLKVNTNYLSIFTFNDDSSPGQRLLHLQRCNAPPVCQLHHPADRQWRSSRDPQQL